jgi:hypothetical protein
MLKSIKVKSRTENPTYLQIVSVLGSAYSFLSLIIYLAS